MKRKDAMKRMSMGWGLASVLLLGACGSASEGGSEGTAATPEDEKLIMYTNADSDGRGEWLEAEAEKAGFEVEIVGAGGGDLTNRLLSEKANPVADVVLGLNHMFFEQLQAEDVLIPYAPEWADEVEAGINDPDGYYHGLVKQALILAYNPEYIEEAKAPSDYVELATNDQFKGQFQARSDMGAATSKVILAGILSQFKDENGEHGVSEEGWETIRQYFEKGVQIPEGEDYFSMFASGKAPIGTMISGELGAKTEQYGTEPAFIHPEAGTPQVVESIAIVNGTDNEEQAQAFIDWYGSAEVQSAFASEFNAMPANEEAVDGVTEFQQTIFENVTPQEIDWEFVTTNMDAWVEKLELEIF